MQINQMIDKRMMRSDPMDDKLTLYRQQVCTITFISTVFLHLEKPK